MHLTYKYWTKSPGIGGFLRKPEDFVVREIVEPTFLRKFQEGKYALFLVKKRNTTTHEAVRLLASLGWRDIGYAGLKDKFSVSWQYMTAAAEPKAYRTGSVEAVPVGMSKKLLMGKLTGNEFVITLHDCAGKENLSSVISELRSNGMPNYFGLQRFGAGMENHIVGKHVVKREFEKALDVINRSGRRYSSLDAVPKGQLKFFVNAYQSWIFNEALNAYMGSNKKPYFRDAPVFGYKTRLGNSAMDRFVKDICRKERVSGSDFRLSELMLACHGSAREAFVRIADIDYAVGSSVKLAFTLPKGSYATIMLREICKSDFTAGRKSTNAHMHAGSAAISNHGRPQAQPAFRHTQ